MDAGFEILHIFKAKKQPFWVIFGPHNIWAEDPIFVTGALRRLSPCSSRPTGRLPRT